MAYVLQIEGKYDAAEEMYKAAYDMQRKLLGDDHVDVALALNNLAFLSYLQGDLDTAISLSKESR